jgi:hypothetical protein
VFGYYEYRLDLGFKELYIRHRLSAGAEYMLSRNVSLKVMITDLAGGCCRDFKIHYKFIYELDIQYRNNYFKLWWLLVDLEMEEFKQLSQRCGIDII